MDCNSNFIAHARTALPAALDALDEADEEIERLRAALKLAQARAEDALDEAQRKIKWAKEECPNGGNDGYITPRPCQCHLQSVVEDRDQWKARAEALEAERDAAVRDIERMLSHPQVGMCEYCSKVYHGTSKACKLKECGSCDAQWRGAQAVMGAEESKEEKL